MSSELLSAAECNALLHVGKVYTCAWVGHKNKPFAIERSVSRGLPQRHRYKTAVVVGLRQLWLRGLPVSCLPIARTCSAEQLIIAYSCFQVPPIEDVFLNLFTCHNIRRFSVLFGFISSVQIVRVVSTHCQRWSEKQSSCLKTWRENVPVCGTLTLLFENKAITTAVLSPRDNLRFVH